jgi:hypothetical protein
VGLTASARNVPNTIDLAAGISVLVSDKEQEDYHKPGWAIGRKGIVRVWERE